MNLPMRRMVRGMAVGMACVAILAASAGLALADGMPAAFDPGKLVKFDDREYRVDYADWVSTDPISSSQVKKIEAGKVSYVSIATTATGTYSTDGLISRNVRYPGIEVTEVTPRENNWMAFWSDGKWYRFASRSGNSFISLRGRH